MSALDKVSQTIKNQYRDRAIKIALGTDEPLNVDLIMKLTELHRQQCGLPTGAKPLVFDSPVAACKAHKELTPSNAFFGCLDAGWLLSAECAWKEGGDESLAPMSILIELCKHVGWFWLCEEFTVITSKPLEIHAVIQNENVIVLHNLAGPAIVYKDGYKLYAIDGDYIVPEDQWMFTDDPATVVNSKKKAEVPKHLKARQAYLKGAAL